MSIVTDGLARSGLLSPASRAAVVAAESVVAPTRGIEASVVACTLEHDPTRLDGVEWIPAATVRGVLRLEPAAPVGPLMARVDQFSVVALADQHPTPVMLAYLEHLLRDTGAEWRVQEEARWVLLRAGYLRLRPELVVALAPRVDRASSVHILTWLAAATACPQLLGALVGSVYGPMRTPVARFAAVAASGGDPAQVFTRELLEAMSSPGQCDPDWLALIGDRRGALLTDVVVHQTGLEQVAALTYSPYGGTAARQEVLAHPHLAGSRAQDAAHAFLERELGCGPMGRAQLLDRSELISCVIPQDIATWVAAGRDCPEDVALAWTMLRRLVDRSDEHPLPGGAGAALVTAMGLVCADRPDGLVRAPALAWVSERAGQVELSSADTLVLAAFVRVATALCSPEGLGVVTLSDLQWVRLAGQTPTWLGRLLGDFFAGVPQVGDPVFVQALLDLEQGFTGTLGDLVTSATAVTA